jgi:hypothetical protein
MGDSIISRIGPKIVQNTGESQSSVMSQKAATSSFASKVHTHTMNDIEPIKVTGPWTLSDLEETFPEYASTFRSVVYMGGAYYMPTNNVQKLVKTTDFITFQMFDFPSLQQGLCYDKKDGIFMTAAGDGGSAATIYTSPDAVNWTSKATTSSINAACLASNNEGTYVLYGNTGLWVSHDKGDNWTQIEPYSGSGALNLIFCNSMFFLPYNENGRKIKYSADGDSWQETTLPQAQITGTYDVGPIAYGNGVYAVTRKYGTYVTISEDLTTWTNITAGGGYGNRGITFGNGAFKLFAQNKQCYSSSDGVNWSVEPGGTTNFEIQNAFYDGNYFVGLTSDQNATLYSKLDYTNAKVRIEDGGTGAATASQALVNLGVPEKPGSGTYNLQCVDGVLQWVSV